MIAFWTPPYSLLGEDDVYMDIIYRVSVVITDVDPEQHKTVESITATVTDPALQKYFSITTNIQNAQPPVNSRASVTIIGKVPLDVFDQYSVEHVEQGFSDKNQPTIVDDVGNVPDKREVYKINVDPRVSTSTFVKIDVTVSDGSTASKVYEIRHRQTYDKIKNWTVNYFGSRY